MNSWIDLNILQPIAQNKENVQQKLSELFSLETQNLPADKYINAINSLVEQIANTLNLDPIIVKAKLGFSDISSAIDETKNSLPAISKEISSLNSSFESIEKSINNMVSSLSLLDSAIKSVTDGTYLSGQEISKLIIKYPELADKIMQASKATSDHSKALNDNKKALENQKKALEDSQKSINSLLDITIKMIKRQKETEKESLKQSLDGYKKKIDLMKQSLDIQKDESHYQKELSDKNSEINKVQNKLSSLQFDDSIEVQKKRKELEEKLKKDEEDLQKFLYDNGIERQKKALDNEYNQFKDSTEKRVKVIEDYLKQEGKIRQEAMKLIESKSQKFYSNLMKWNVDYGDGMTSTVINSWNKAYSALNRFNSKQVNFVDTLQNIADQMLGITFQIENANKAMNNLSNTSKETAKSLNLASKEYQNIQQSEKQIEIAKKTQIFKLHMLIQKFIEIDLL